MSCVQCFEDGLLCSVLSGSVCFLCFLVGVNDSYESFRIGIRVLALQFRAFYSVVGLAVIVEKRILSSQYFLFVKAVTPSNGDFKGSNHDFWNPRKILHQIDWLRDDFEKSYFLVFRS